MLKFMVYTGLLAQPPLTYNEYNCTLKIWRGHDLHNCTPIQQSVCANEAVIRSLSDWHTSRFHDVY